MREPVTPPLGAGKTEPRPPRSIFVSNAPAARAALMALEPLLVAAPDLRLPAGWTDAAARYVALLLDANAHTNLTRVTAPLAIARDHLLDALAALPLLDAAEPGRVVDLGSGGGVPAIPLALARPDVRWTLIDSVGKKAALLREFVAALELRNVTVVAERIETIGRLPAHRERYAIATARACAALPVLAELAMPLLSRGGRLVAWKGPLGRDDAEVRDGDRALRVVGGGRLEIRPTGRAALGDRMLVVAMKERATPAAYPRRPGEPKRRPLPG